MVGFMRRTAPRVRPAPFSMPRQVLRRETIAPPSYRHSHRTPDSSSPTEHSKGLLSRITRFCGALRATANSLPRRSSSMAMYLSALRPVTYTLSTPPVGSSYGTRTSVLRFPHPSSTGWCNSRAWPRAFRQLATASDPRDSRRRRPRTVRANDGR